ncbi:hypothetical protein DL546_007621 [Coniochaeta pulveracea]|uniref:RING-type domain-containing protein n=1 Tax=Coniochaeta pulveracea TaxID=177199 RepID=A0A420YNK1_9PEZI|nr:hypothetical protein DL546_007621 [Coniochaeta pulveracea]
MCIENLYSFDNCAAFMAGRRQNEFDNGMSHGVNRIIRCSGPWMCKQLSATGEMFHVGECPACLPGGAIFPLESFSGRCALVRAGQVMIQQQCTEIGQHLLDWCVLWLSAFWDGPEPLSHDPSVQASLDKAALRHHYASVFCEECGSSRGTAAFADDPGPCATCPGVLARAPGVGTASLAILLQTEIARVAYNNKYLAEVKAGNHENLRTEIVSQAPIPGPLDSEIAGQLVLRRWHAIDLLQDEQQPLDDFLSTLIQDLHLFYDSATNSDVDPVEKAEWHRFTDLAGKILGVATWVLAADTGLHPRHKLQTLRYMSPALLHPRAPVAAVQDRHRDVCTPVTCAAVLGYLGLPDPADAIDRMTTVFRDVYIHIQTRRVAEVNASRQTKEGLVRSRLAYHTQQLTRPPDDDWICGICQETDGETDGQTDGVNLVKLGCQHVLHHQCMVNNGVLGERLSTTRCPLCRIAWDGIVFETDETTFGQESPWYDYDLAGVRE